MVPTVMKHSIHLMLVLLAACSLAAQTGGSTQAPRTMFVTYDRAHLYDSASYLSNVLDTLPLGDSVIVTGRSGDYLKVTHGNRTGYVLASNLAVLPKGSAQKRPSQKRSASKQDTTTKQDAASKPGPAATREAATGTRSDAPRPDRSSKEGSRVQCAAVTKSGKPCSRMTADPSGYCWQHRK
jgi:hypothetical protein